MTFKLSCHLSAFAVGLNEMARSSCCPDCCLPTVTSVLASHFICTIEDCSFIPRSLVCSHVCCNTVAGGNMPVTDPPSSRHFKVVGSSRISRETAECFSFLYVPVCKYMH
jgi:hypothetical protein